MKKVLILDGGAAHAMAIAECLKKSGYGVAVICDGRVAETGTVSQVFENPRSEVTRLLLSEKEA